MKMKTKISVISDIHYADKRSCNGNRYCDIGNILLSKAVEKINSSIKPDLVCLPGDLTDQADIKHLLELRDILKSLKCPYIAIPGNHDCMADVFFNILSEPPDYLDIGCCRFITFVDNEEPGYNASRTDAEIDRMYHLADEWPGQVITLQHVPLFNNGSYSSYNYINSDEIIKIMMKCGVTHTISGHYHPGFYLPDDSGLSVITAPALCEKPFNFLDVTITSKGKTTVKKLSIEGVFNGTV